ncbi:cytochrome B5 [Rummeliibacillus suwonensis]|uniref:cytochrome B5 n=1 Tax=Rummeliibacillus suwonensis TaxID=1306154 RepID=UPI001AAF2942|nr:cytochrome B5 [Rummeliibacillus suwonensis]MBO2537263.1 cytochrome B5 [Rummeliibacillus suwonensis]
MHLHKYERYWLIFGGASLVIFLLITGIMAFHYGSHPPSAKKTINYEQVEQIAPFNKPGVHKVSGKDWDYEVVLVASAFYYNPPELKVPVGSKVKFIITSKDVVHGFEITGTNVNMMAEPGYISEYTTTVDKVGDYLIVCSEYCGVGHAQMHSMLRVVDSK